MDSIISNLLEHGLSSSTRSAYQSGVRRYLQFCMLYRLQPWPLAETTLCRFVAYLSQYRLAPSSIHLYLSALRFCQISSGGADLRMSSLPRLHYTLRGLSRQQASHRWPKRLPITPSILRCLHRVWSAQPLTYDRVMLWAAACLGFFGFLHVGEFTHTSQRPCPLSPAHIRVDSHVQPTYITVLLTNSKTDVFGTGVTLVIGHTGGSICPVAALLAYLAVRSSAPGPLFIRENGSPLTRVYLVAAVRSALSQAGINVQGYSGHSFRIGAASAAAAAGLSDSLIQSLGRWKSSAFMTYIRTPPEHLIAVSLQLLNY